MPFLQGTTQTERAVPIAFRMYRSKKRCPKTQYRKRTELAREMVEELIFRIPQEQGDSSQPCPRRAAGLFVSETGGAL